jgi:hypothetical protein
LLPALCEKCLASLVEGSTEVGVEKHGGMVLARTSRRAVQEVHEPVRVVGRLHRGPAVATLAHRRQATPGGEMPAAD